MAQTSIQVELPEPLVEYVVERVEYGEFETPSDYLKSLIREDDASAFPALLPIQLGDEPPSHSASYS